MSALPPKADMCGALVHVRFGPKADIHSSAPTKRETPGNCPGFYCISRSGYVESTWAFRQASARAKRKARAYLRCTGSGLQRFIGDECTAHVNDLRLNSRYRKSKSSPGGERYRDRGKDHAMKISRRTPAEQRYQQSDCAQRPSSSNTTKRMDGTVGQKDQCHDGQNDKE